MFKAFQLKNQPPSSQLPPVQVDQVFSLNGTTVPSNEWWVIIGVDWSVLAPSFQPLTIKDPSGNIVNVLGFTITGSSIPNAALIGQVSEPTAPKTTVTFLDGLVFIQQGLIYPSVRALVKPGYGIFPGLTVRGQVVKFNNLTDALNML